MKKKRRCTKFKQKVKLQHASLRTFHFNPSACHSASCPLCGQNPEAVRAAECGEKSAESENDPETRDSEALIKRVRGSALHRETT